LTLCTTPFQPCIAWSLDFVHCRPSCLSRFCRNTSGVIGFKELSSGICKFQFGNAKCLLFFQVLKIHFDFLTTGGNICRNMAATSIPLVMRYLRFPQTHQNSLGAETVPCHSLQFLLGDVIISINTVWAGRTRLQTYL